MTQPTVSKHWRRVVSHPDRPQSNHAHLTVLQFLPLISQVSTWPLWFKPLKGSCEPYKSRWPHRALLYRQHKLGPKTGVVTRMKLKICFLFFATYVTTCLALRVRLHEKYTTMTLHRCWLPAGLSHWLTTCTSSYVTKLKWPRLKWPRLIADCTAWMVFSRPCN